MSKVMTSNKIQVTAIILVLSFFPFLPWLHFSLC